MLWPATNVEPVEVSVDCATRVGSTPPIARTSAPPLVLIRRCVAVPGIIYRIVREVEIWSWPVGLKTSALFSGVPSEVNLPRSKRDARYPESPIGVACRQPFEQAWRLRLHSGSALRRSEMATEIAEHLVSFELAVLDFAHGTKIVLQVSLNARSYWVPKTTCGISRSLAVIVLEKRSGPAPISSEYLRYAVL
jgi:hypothetical protein